MKIANRPAFPYRNIAFILLFATLWLSLATARHQIDINLEHHAHHDCQLFSPVYQAPTGSVTPIAPHFQHILTCENESRNWAGSKPLLFRARSPPFSV